MTIHRNWRKAALLSVASSFTIAAVAPLASAQETITATSEKELNIPAGALGDTLVAISSEFDVSILANESLVDGKTAGAIQGDMGIESALSAALDGQMLSMRPLSSGAIVIEEINSSGTTDQFNPDVATPLRVSERVASEDARVEQTVIVEGTRYNFDETSSVTRTNLPIQELASSVTVITAGSIQDRAAITIEEIVGNVAGTTPSRGNQITLRGILNDFGLASSNRLNGFAGNTAYEPDYYTFDRVEVVKGPVAISGGFINPGGFINTVQKLAAPGDFGNLSAQVTDFGQVRVQGDFNHSFNDGSSARIVVGTLYGDQFVREVRRNHVAVVPSFRSKLGESTDFSVWANIFLQRGEANIGQSVNLGSDPILDSDFNFDYGGDEEEVDAFDINGEIVHEFLDDLTLTARFSASTTESQSFSSYQYSYDFELGIPDDGEVYIYATERRNDEERFTGDVYLTKSFDLAGGQSSFIVGSEFLSFEGTNFLSFEFLGFDNVFNPRNNFSYPAGADLEVILDNGFTDASLYSAYGQTVLRPAENFVVTAAIRYDSFENESLQQEGILSSKKEDELTWNVGASYRLDQINSNIYASYSTGFTPSPFGRTIDGEILDAETANQAEVGIKTSLADGRADLTLALYRLEQEGTPIADPNDENFQINGGVTVVEGLEIEIAGELFPGFDVSGGVAFTNPEITEGIPVAGGELQVGDRPEYATTINGGVVASYQVQNGALEGLRFGGSVRHVGERARSETRVLQAFTTGNLFAEYSIGGVDLGVFVTNVTDETYVEFSNIPNYTFYGIGRSATFRISKDF